MSAEEGDDYGEDVFDEEDVEGVGFGNVEGHNDGFEDEEVSQQQDVDADGYGFQDEFEMEANHQKGSEVQDDAVVEREEMFGEDGNPDGNVGRVTEGAGGVGGDDRREQQQGNSAHEDYEEEEWEDVQGGKGDVSAQDGEVGEAYEEASHYENATSKSEAEGSGGDENMAGESCDGVVEDTSDSPTMNHNFDSPDKPPELRTLSPPPTHATPDPSPKPHQHAKPPHTLPLPPLPTKSVTISTESLSIPYTEMETDSASTSSPITKHQRHVNERTAKPPWRPPTPGAHPDTRVGVEGGKRRGGGRGRLHLHVPRRLVTPIEEGSRPPWSTPTGRKLHQADEVKEEAERVVERLEAAKSIPPSMTPLPSLAPAGSWKGKRRSRSRWKSKSGARSPWSRGSHSPSHIPASSRYGQTVSAAPTPHTPPTVSGFWKTVGSRFISQINLPAWSAGAVAQRERDREKIRKMKKEFVERGLTKEERDVEECWKRVEGCERKGDWEGVVRGLCGMLAVFVEGIDHLQTLTNLHKTTQTLPHTTTHLLLSLALLRLNLPKEALISALTARDIVAGFIERRTEEVLGHKEGRMKIQERIRRDCVRDLEMEGWIGMEADVERVVGVVVDWRLRGVVGGGGGGGL
ncbi:hypothetical protein HDV00_006032 [Rhizophlyctis rosea]|nr:hypothetical protein HDV00_006032 [Rhizophlyctis rosea]